MSNLGKYPIHHCHTWGHGELLKPLLELSCFFFPKCPVARTSSESARALAVGLTLGVLWYPNSQSVFVGVSLSCLPLPTKSTTTNCSSSCGAGYLQWEKLKIVAAFQLVPWCLLGCERCAYESESQLSFFVGEELYQPFFIGKTSTNQTTNWTGGSEGKLHCHPLCGWLLISGGLWAASWSDQVRLMQIHLLCGDQRGLGHQSHDTAGSCAFGPPQEHNFKQVKKTNGKIND